MPIAVSTEFSHVLSVYDGPDFMRCFIPNVLPGEFYIPGVGMSKREIESKCRTAYREPGSAAPESYNYAEIRKSPEGRQYILITVPNAITISAGTDEQKKDEWNNRLQPDVSRARLVVKSAQLANEIEHQMGETGIIAIELDRSGSVKAADLDRAFDLNLRWKMKQIAETSRLYPRFGAAVVTPQVIKIAGDLVRAHKLASLPDWALLDVNATSDSVMSCKGCNAQVPRDAIKCAKCGAIYKWKEAVEYGMVKLTDVPPSKRAEVGLAPATEAPANA